MARTRPARSSVPYLVSAAAVVVAIVHVAVPSLKIDATTFALLGVAALPWLAPVLKSITLPGGFELVLQDLKDEVGSVKEQVEESSRRVEHLASTVQELLFEGEPVEPERREEISGAVADFRGFLADCGLAVPAVPPTVRVDPELEWPYYSEGQIVIGPETPADATYRLYAHHVLGAMYDGRPFAAGRLGMQYGLAFYFTSSYRQTTPVFDESALGSDAQPDIKAGAKWSLVMWELRELLPPAAADQSVATAWVRSIGRRAEFTVAFMRQLLDVVAEVGSPEVAKRFRAVLEAEGAHV